MRKPLLFAGLAVVTAGGVVAHNLYRAGQELSQVTGRLARIVPSGPQVSAPPVDRLGATDPARSTTTDAPQTAAVSPLDFDGPSTIEEYESSEASADPLTSIQMLLNDPDPAVRDEAAALVEAWNGEQASVTEQPVERGFPGP